MTGVKGRKPSSQLKETVKKLKKVKKPKVNKKK